MLFPTAHSAFALRCAAAFLVLVATWLVVLGLFNLRHPSDWAMGDWLINYSGGFVRRGLVGEGALLLGHVGVPPLLTVLALQWSLYAVVLLTVWRLLQRSCWSWWLAALFFSPATLAFVLQDPPFAFRKEILFFALLALTLDVAHIARQGWRRGALLSALLCLGVGVCILSHEGQVVYLPYLLAALLLGGLPLRRAVALFAAPAVTALSLFVLVSHFPGNAHTAQRVCQSIGGHLTTPPSGICGGAIDYLAHDAPYAHRQVLEVARADRYARRIPFLFVLPLLPVALGITSLCRRHRSTAQIVLSLAAVSWLLSLSLFWYGTDWTRWVSIHAVCSLLLLLRASRGPRGPAHGERALPTPMQPWDLRRGLALCLLLLYCLGWQLSVYGQRPLYAGFFRFVLYHVRAGTV